MSFLLPLVALLTAPVSAGSLYVNGVPADGLRDFEFYTTDLKYFPLRFLHEPVEKRWGFFLQITATKPPK